jgi:hypothetical protein
MVYLKYVSYLYLAIAAFFIFEGVRAILNNEDSIIMFVLAAGAVFMFFFRRNFQKKMDPNRKN